jgi:hypothetical protein
MERKLILKGKRSPHGTSYRAAISNKTKGRAAIVRCVVERLANWQATTARNIMSGEVKWSKQTRSVMDGNMHKEN